MADVWDVLRYCAAKGNVMAKSFYLGSDAEMLSGSAIFSTQISLSPASYGLSQAQSADFAVLADDYAMAYNTAISPTTRTVSAVAAKKAARSVLKKMAGDLTDIINATPMVSDAMKIGLGLGIRAARSKIPVPPMSPKIGIQGVQDRTVKIKIYNADSTKRGRPNGVAGAFLYSFVGEIPPADLGEWTFHGGVSLTKAEVVFNSNVQPFAKVWLTAAWVNPRQQAGVAGTPVSTNLGTWMVQNVPALKVAA